MIRDKAGKISARKGKKLRVSMGKRIRESVKAFLHKKRQGSKKIPKKTIKYRFYAIIEQFSTVYKESSYDENVKRLLMKPELH